MAAQLKAHQEAEAAKRKARIEASKQYQNALDNQLNELRQRSLHSLQGIVAVSYENTCADCVI